MFGYTSPSTFDPEAGYGSVQLQQGMPITDADWNENAECLSRQISTLAMATIGWHGSSDGGFRVSFALGSNTVRIHHGVYYVDGKCLDAGSETVEVKVSDSKRSIWSPNGVQGFHIIYVEAWDAVVPAPVNQGIMSVRSNQRLGLRRTTMWSLRVAKTSAAPLMEQASEPYVGPLIPNAPWPVITRSEDTLRWFVSNGILPPIPPAGFRFPRLKVDAIAEGDTSIAAVLGSGARPNPCCIELECLEKNAASIKLRLIDRSIECEFRLDRESTTLKLLRKQDVQRIAGQSPGTIIEILDEFGEVRSAGKLQSVDADGLIKLADLTSISDDLEICNSTFTKSDAGEWEQSRERHFVRVVSIVTVQVPNVPSSDSDPFMVFKKAGKIVVANPQFCARGDKWQIFINESTGVVFDSRGNAIIPDKPTTWPKPERRLLAPIGKLIFNNGAIHIEYPFRKQFDPPGYPKHFLPADGAAEEASPTGWYAIDASHSPTSALPLAESQRTDPLPIGSRTNEDSDETPVMTFLSDAGLSALKQYFTTPKEVLRRIPARYLKTTVSYSPLAKWLAPALLSEIADMSFEDFTKEFQDVHPIPNADWAIFEREAKDVLEKAQQFSRMMASNAGIQSLLS
jgi:hypothetical protein